MPYTLFVTGPVGVTRCETPLNLEELRAAVRAIPFDGTHQVFICDGPLVPIEPNGTIRVAGNRRTVLVPDVADGGKNPIPGQWGRPVRSDPLPE